jgi:hypothetical protein
MPKIVTLGYTEIKNPFAFLVKADTDSTTVWFQVEGNTIASWDDLRMNYPRWVFCVHAHKEAIQRITEMIEDEGWELVSTTEPELNSLVVEN